MLVVDMAADTDTEDRIMLEAKSIGILVMNQNNYWSINPMCK